MEERALYNALQYDYTAGSGATCYQQIVSYSHMRVIHTTHERYMYFKESMSAVRLLDHALDTALCLSQGRSAGGTRSRVHRVHSHRRRRPASNSRKTVAKRSALDETHGPDWLLLCNLRHGWEPRQR